MEGWEGGKEGGGGGGSLRVGYQRRDGVSWEEGKEGERRGDRGGREGGKTEKR